MLCNIMKDISCVKLQNLNLLEKEVMVECCNYLKDRWSGMVRVRV